MDDHKPPFPDSYGGRCVARWPGSRMYSGRGGLLARYDAVTEFIFDDGWLTDNQPEQIA